MKRQRWKKVGWVWVRGGLGERPCGMKQLSYGTLFSCKQSRQCVIGKLFPQEGDWYIPAGQDLSPKPFLSSESCYSVLHRSFTSNRYVLSSLVAGPLKHMLGTIIPNCILKDAIVPNPGVWSWLGGRQMADDLFVCFFETGFLCAALEPVLELCRQGWP